MNTGLFQMGHHENVNVVGQVQQLDYLYVASWRNIVWLYLDVWAFGSPTQSLNLREMMLAPFTMQDSLSNHLQ